MLIELAGSAPYDDTGSSGDHSGKSGFLLPTVTGAMYLLISSTTHDLFAGFSLLVDGSSPGHRAFGVGLLLVHGVMVVAAMTVLVSTSDDSASVVLNAVTVLFIADLASTAGRSINNYSPLHTSFTTRIRIIKRQHISRLKGKSTSSRNRLRCIRTSSMMPLGAVLALDTVSMQVRTNIFCVFVIIER